MPILVEKRQLVVPGELLAEGQYYSGDNTFSEGSRVYSSRVGLADISGTKLFVVPFKGCYLPFVDDIVIGRVVDVGLHGWTVDITCPYFALLPASETYSRKQFERDLSKVYDVGDLIMAKVIAFDRTRDPLISAKGPGLGRVTSGTVVQIEAAKIPRLIGRNGSMISMLKTETGSNILVGQNGIVVVSGRTPKNEQVAIEAIHMIEREAHTRGLTDRIQEMIRSQLGGKIPETRETSSEAS